ncbi:hypothetical protein BP5796_04471 [Coleophoma crateriformis]|uniref:Uncharacterized protein n=1 Tax=Coleophoma crateriformis TaxID=565419 RepID=A0A3D8S9P7_9HELO|nr:hypothetical protein BP5796_04471 [Coleophoma crateriformis]
MFEHFTFGALAQTPSSLLQGAEPSPRDTSLPLSPTYFECPAEEATPLPAGISDLVKTFDNQNLTPENYFHSLPSPPMEIDDSPDHDEGMCLAEFNIQPAPSTSSLRSISAKARAQTIQYRRLQRQLNVQLQSCTEHVRDINILVDQMVASETQCRVSSRPYKPAPIQPQNTTTPFIEVDLAGLNHDVVEEVDEDEGFVDGDYPDEDIFSIRRAHAPSGIRKHGFVKWKSSVESVGCNRVYSVPRMRKRNPTRDLR